MRCAPLRGIALAVFASVSVLVAPLAAVREAPAVTRAARARPGAELGRRLRVTGHGEARFVRDLEDPISGEIRHEPGRLALEPPDRAMLEFAATGERVTLRAEGGEWLHPGLRQLVTFDRDHIAGASVWWRLLMNGKAPGVIVKALGSRRLALDFAGTEGPGHATLELGRDGLPAAFTIPEAGGAMTYRFLGWAFSPPRGAVAFTQTAPAGYNVVAMP